VQVSIHNIESTAVRLSNHTADNYPYVCVTVQASTPTSTHSDDVQLFFGDLKGVHDLCHELLDAYQKAVSA